MEHQWCPMVTQISPRWVATETLLGRKGMDYTSRTCWMRDTTLTKAALDTGYPEDYERCEDWELPPV